MPLSARKKQYLKTMGIPLWNARPGFFTTVEAEIDSDSLHETPPVVPNNDLIEKQQGTVDWHTLQQTVAQCMACDLHKTRTNTVFGVGNEQADWMIIGEAPGADEDARGEPFVGKAGQLLNQMMLGVGLSREQVFIANILKCRPPNNRDPHKEEVTACSNFLQQQIEYINPKVILAVGRVSAQNLLNTKETIGRIRGKVHHYASTGIPIVATYHPAYLLRSPLEKRKSWGDLLLAKRVMQGQL